MSIINLIKCIFLRSIKFAESENCKMVLVVRSDLSMGRGKAAAQCAHAAIECYRQITRNTKYQCMFESWLLHGQPTIVLRIPSEEELMSLARSARKAGLIISIIKDAGRTQIQPGTISTLGIGPGPQTLIDDLTSKLKLL